MSEKTIFSSENNNDSESGTPKTKSNRPLLTGGDENIAAWVSQDSNGNYYLDLKLPLGLSTKVFLTDEFKPAFNQMINHLIDEGKLDAEAIK